MHQQLYMLDTNIASFIIKGANPEVRKRLLKTPQSSISISSITEAEILHGLAKKPEAVQLHSLAMNFLARVNILPWDSESAASYGKFRAAIEAEGKMLSAMDMLIAAHSIAVDAVIVTADKAFHKLEKHLHVEDWTVKSNH